MPDQCVHSRVSQNTRFAKHNQNFTILHCNEIEVVVASSRTELQVWNMIGQRSLYFTQAATGNHKRMKHAARQRWKRRSRQPKFVLQVKSGRGWRLSAARHGTVKQALNEHLQRYRHVWGSSKPRDYALCVGEVASKYLLTNRTR